MSKTKKPSQLGFMSSRLVKIAAVIIVLGVAVVMILQLTHTTHFFRKPTPKPVPVGSTANSETKGEPQTGNKSSNGSTTVPPSPAGQAKASNESNAVLVAPTGTFVSNHHPDLSGSPESNSMESNCNTTPGATCQIIFTQNGVIKRLDARPTDVDGGAYWNWKLQDIGLTQGTWKVEAKAVLGSQTKTSYDSLDLEVGP